MCCCNIVALGGGQGHDLLPFQGPEDGAAVGGECVNHDGTPVCSCAAICICKDGVCNTHQCILCTGDFDVAEAGKELAHENHGYHFHPKEYQYCQNKKKLRCTWQPAQLQTGASD